MLLLKRRNGTSELVIAPANACKSCGLCARARTGPEAASEQVPLQLALPAGALMRIAFAVYGMPLAGLLLGALITAALGAADAGTIAGAVAGIAFGLTANRRSARHIERQALAQLEVRPAGQA